MVFKKRFPFFPKLFLSFHSMNAHNSFVQMFKYWIGLLTQTTEKYMLWLFFPQRCLISLIKLMDSVFSEILIRRLRLVFLQHSGRPVISLPLIDLHRFHLVSKDKHSSHFHTYSSLKWLIWQWQFELIAGFAFYIAEKIFCQGLVLCFISVKDALSWPFNTQV